ncbi:Rieske (2Fe-2S) protein [Corynebacterium uterequi]|uniref:Ferredoxin subunit of nitrite reductase and ring-hydroxylating dioxygenase n=1 Tax=Corynebacterium uterequi TaxID=1072256 RepID=A0A0G3HJS3_9CORY|nr:Rieske (2Fe-2S) protein [Corynebacterium uterequi]AKK12173.1 ferredoxin subunit of nitrite reductase and ring-hydroxylating dioxygenase [Corynebacterium uterequi]
MTIEMPTCSRRLFLLGSATTVAGAFLAACGEAPTAEVAAAEVPVGSAIFVDDFIIAQPTAGTFVAYSRTCPHQNAQIDGINGDTVSCSNHDSVFALADGAVLEGLARDPLTPAETTVTGDVVTATL